MVGSYIGSHVLKSWRPIAKGYSSAENYNSGVVYVNSLTFVTSGYLFSIRSFPNTNKRYP
jgi:hypothetical protein